MGKSAKGSGSGKVSGMRITSKWLLYVNPTDNVLQIEFLAFYFIYFRLFGSASEKNGSTRTFGCHQKDKPSIDSFGGRSKFAAASGSVSGFRDSGTIDPPQIRGYFAFHAVVAWQLSWQDKQQQ